MCCSLDFVVFFLFSLTMLAPLELVMGGGGGGPAEVSTSSALSVSSDSSNSDESISSPDSEDVSFVWCCYHRLDQTKAQGLGQPMMTF